MSNYDQWASQYNSIVDNEVSQKTGIIETSYQFVLEQLYEYVDPSKIKICDLGCGQGELSFRLSKLGAAVTGIDVSDKLLELARNKSGAIKWVCDDAMKLKQIADNSFDVAISNLMLMDVPDFQSVFKSAYRVLVPEGIFVCVIMHPCFQSPFSYPLEDGSRNVSSYSAQHWKSKGSGTLRSTLGAYHQPISEYLNKLLESGFSIIHLNEPLTKGSTSSVPSLFGIVAQKFNC
ncbi:ubiquinone/menaquinone biosynthesis C-methylase UbiE [Lederbergia galactosidilyticus]|uniref:class I SAM-dependent methyltransferase n=1 Tax=Lederbergia galactosidilytica TaxID=217031 RepID=UPI0007172B6C|nr:methyltransferase [Lederbergia galactosidilytica]MBP1916712.1 ubiquinone/menaquinone biosynthesis C-methylase UbiE [Lederbergia galactosidilytica]